jgi:hypothetical protein
MNNTIIILTNIRSYKSIIIKAIIPSKTIKS